MSSLVTVGNSPAAHEGLFNWEPLLRLHGRKRVVLSVVIKPAIKPAIFWLPQKAIAQQLREDSCCLELKDGKSDAPDFFPEICGVERTHIQIHPKSIKPRLDLTGFMCVLAQESSNYHADPCCLCQFFGRRHAKTMSI